MTDTVKPVRGSQKSKQEIWKRHIADWKTSGLTQKQYCRDNRLKLPTFHYWKSKFERQSLTKPLLPVAIKPTVTASTQPFPSGISITVNDQLSIQLEVCFNRDTLLNLLDLLESR